MRNRYTAPGNLINPFNAFVLTDRLQMADTIDILGNSYLTNTAYILVSESPYLVGLLNSKLMTFCLGLISSEIRGGYLRWLRQYVPLLPIRLIEPNNRSDKAIHDRITSLVERMLTLHQQQTTATTDHERPLLERQITATDRQIDQLVYALYGLTDEEIDLVEGDSG